MRVVFTQLIVKVLKSWFFPFRWLALALVFDVDGTHIQLPLLRWMQSLLCSWCRSVSFLTPFFHVTGMHHYLEIVNYKQLQFQFYVKVFYYILLSILQVTVRITFGRKLFATGLVYSLWVSLGYQMALPLVQTLGWSDSLKKSLRRFLPSLGLLSFN